MSAQFILRKIPQHSYKEFYTDEKYFNYSAADGTGTVAGLDNAIGYGIRTSVEQGGLATYTVAIDEDGTMELTPDTLDYLL